MPVSGLEEVETIDLHGIILDKYRIRREDLGRFGKEVTVVYFLKFTEMFGQSEKGRGSTQERTRAKPEA